MPSANFAAHESDVSDSSTRSMTRTSAGIGLDLWRLIERRREARKVARDTLAEYVFHRDGRRLQRTPHYWRLGCVAAKLPDSSSTTCAVPQFATGSGRASPKW